MARRRASRTLSCDPEAKFNPFPFNPSSFFQYFRLGSVPEVTFRGYAYTGGGRMVTRVELTSDGGATWRQAEVHRFEKPTEYGRHWCWVQWTAKLPIGSLVRSREVSHLARPANRAYAGT